MFVGKVPTLSVGLPKDSGNVLLAEGIPIVHFGLSEG